MPVMTGNRVPRCGSTPIFPRPFWADTCIPSYGMPYWMCGPTSRASQHRAGVLQTWAGNSLMLTGTSGPSARNLASRKRLWPTKAQLPAPTKCSIPYSLPGRGPSQLLPCVT